MQQQSPATNCHDWRHWHCPRLLIELKLALRQGAGSALLAAEAHGQDLSHYLQRQGIVYQLAANRDGQWRLSWLSGTANLNSAADLNAAAPPQELSPYV